MAMEMAAEDESGFQFMPTPSPAAAALSKDVLELLEKW